jgi:hypothetical protein
MKIAIGMVLGFVLGFGAHLVFFGQPTTKHHWRVVEHHNAYLRDPANYTRDAATGLSVVTLPSDPLPNLAALVAAGELSHANLVLPTVAKTRESSRFWMAFCEAHKEIVYATGNPSYTAFKPAGTQPLHLNLWFRDSDQAVVQTLIRELEERYAE